MKDLPIRWAEAKCVDESVQGAQQSAIRRCGASLSPAARRVNPGSFFCDIAYSRSPAAFTPQGVEINGGNSDLEWS
jgi:hypothetical protein